MRESSNLQLCECATRCSGLFCRSIGGPARVLARRLSTAASLQVSRAALAMQQTAVRGGDRSCRAEGSGMPPKATSPCASPKDLTDATAAHLSTAVCMKRSSFRRVFSFVCQQSRHRHLACNPNSSTPSDAKSTAPAMAGTCGHGCHLSPGLPGRARRTHPAQEQVASQHTTVLQAARPPAPRRCTAA